MRILLDTHTLLWHSLDNSKLSAVAESLIEDADNEKLISIASCWEIAIKTSIGKLDLAVTVEELLAVPLAREGWTLLSPKLDEFVTVSELPLHHRDPFDRLLVAQAIVGSFPLVSRDEPLDRYPIERIW